MINKGNFFSYNPHQWQPSLPLPANFYAVELNLINTVLISTFCIIGILVCWILYSIVIDYKSNKSSEVFTSFRVFAQKYYAVFAFFFIVATFITALTFLVNNIDGVQKELIVFQQEIEKLQQILKNAIFQNNKIALQLEGLRLRHRESQLTIMWLKATIILLVSATAYLGFVLYCRRNGDDGQNKNDGVASFSESALEPCSTPDECEKLPGSDIIQNSTPTFTYLTPTDVVKLEVDGGLGQLIITKYGEKASMYQYDSYSGADAFGSSTKVVRITADIDKILAHNVEFFQEIENKLPKAPIPE
jgi:uncharacterized membrane protein